MNVIHRQVLDFTIDDSLDYFGLPEKIRALYWSSILPGIDEVFSKLAPADQVYRFDQLEIDLGTLDPEILDIQIAEQLEKNLQKAIREALQSGTGAWRTDMDTPGVTATSPAVEKTDLLIHFLQTGCFPWWSPYSGALDQLFQDILATGPSRFADFLRQQATPAQTERLARQFSAELIDAFLDTGSPGWKPLRADFQKAAAIQGKTSTRAGHFDIVFSRWAITMFIRNRPPEPVAIKELIALLARLEDRSPKAMTAQIQSVFKSVAPASKAVRDFLQAIDKSPVEIQPKIGGPADSNPAAAGEPASRSGPELPAPDRTPNVAQPGQARKIEAILADGVFIKNAGLVLVAPFFRNLFEKAKLLDGNRFLSEAHQERAVLLSQYLATSQREFDESDLLLNKVLCGWPLENTLAHQFTPHAREKRAVKELLDSVITHWTALGNVSHSGFCNTFLLRQGKLALQEDQVKLLVERKAFDILLEKLPWNISLLRSAWMHYPVWVEW